jgi:hypothetical protein
VFFEQPSVITLTLGGVFMDLLGLTFMRNIFVVILPFKDFTDYYFCDSTDLRIPQMSFMM